MAELPTLKPPRKHYHLYYSTREADGNMRNCPQGIHAFLRAYYHHKSADWKDNRPHKLQSWSASELAKLPTYYVMELDKGMAETVAAHMPTKAEIAACTWLTEAELSIYAAEYHRTGFQGGLNWYRTRTSGCFEAEQEVFSGRSIDVPSCFISGKSDWGVYQAPAAFERMQEKACTRMMACQLVDGAGHWVQQEQPEAVCGSLLAFLQRVEQG
jgi:pimeloyl-ACP methyl ester carboxylesterase